MRQETAGNGQKQHASHCALLAATRNICPSRTEEGDGDGDSVCAKEGWSVLQVANSPRAGVILAAC